MVTIFVIAVVTVATGGTAALASFSIFGFTGASAWVAATVALTSLYFLARKWMPRAGAVSAEQSRARSQVSSPAEEPRWIVGRARVGGHLVHVNDFTRGAGLAGEDIGIAWVLVLGEGRCEGIERVWVNGKEAPFGDYSFRLKKYLAPLQPDGDRYWPIGSVLTYKNRSSVGHDNFRWTADSSDSGAPNDLFRCGIYYGGDEYDPNHVHPWNAPGEYDLDGCTFPNDAQLVGKTYMVCWAAQYGERGNWLEQGGITAGPQNVNVLVRGLKMPRPDGDPVWSENAAAIRYWWHTHILGVAPEDIDQNEWRAAYEICNQQIVVDEVTEASPRGQLVLDASLTPAERAMPERRARAIREWNENEAGYGFRLNGEPKNQIRYSINGVITGGEVRRNPKQTEDAMDQAWAGYMVQNGQKYIMRPGVRRTPRIAITEENIVENVPRMQVEPALSDKGNAIDAEILSSAGHNWTSHRMSRIVDEVAKERDDGVEFVFSSGIFRFVAYERTAYRLAWIMLRQFSENRILNVQLPVFRQDGDPAYGHLLVTDAVTVNLPEYGLGGIWRLTTLGIGANDGVVAAQLLEEPPNLYDTNFPIPLGTGNVNLQPIDPPRAVDLIPVSYSSDASGETWQLPGKVGDRFVQYQWERLKGNAADRTQGVKIDLVNGGTVQWGWNSGQSEYSLDELVTDPFTAVTVPEGHVGSFYLTAGDDYNNEYSYDILRDDGSVWYTRNATGRNVFGTVPLNPEDRAVINDGINDDGRLVVDPNSWVGDDINFRIGDEVVGVLPIVSFGDVLVLQIYIRNPDHIYDPDDGTRSAYPIPRRSGSVFSRWFTFYDGNNLVTAQATSYQPRRYNSDLIGAWDVRFSDPNVANLFRNLQPGDTVVVRYGTAPAANVVGLAFTPPNPTTLDVFASGDSPIEYTIPASETFGRRVSARYVARGADDNWYPISDWASAKGDWVHLDAGFYMAGSFQSSVIRLPRVAFRTGVASSVNRTLMDVNVGDPRLRLFDEAVDLGFPARTDWVDTGYESPLDNLPINFPFTTNGRLQVSGTPEVLVDWRMRVGGTHSDTNVNVTSV